MPGNEILTIKEVARKLRVPSWKVSYAVTSRRIEPFKRAGAVKLFIPDQIPQIQLALRQVKAFGLGLPADEGQPTPAAQTTDTPAAPIAATAEPTVEPADPADPAEPATPRPRGRPRKNPLPAAAPAAIADASPSTAEPSAEPGPDSTLTDSAPSSPLAPSAGSEPTAGTSTPDTTV